MVKITQLHNTTPEQLAETILKGVDDRLRQFEKNFEPREADEYLTAKELEKVLKISAVTRWNWGQKLILKPKKIGNRTYYLRSDIKELLLNSNK
jgi:hypothetical protein